MQFEGSWIIHIRVPGNFIGAGTSLGPGEGMCTAAVFVSTEVGRVLYRIFCKRGLSLTLGLMGGWGGGNF